VALATDGNGRYAALDPRAGAALAVAEAARNVAGTGARPIAVTNCLNFASPERPEVMGAFAAAVDGMAAACHALGLPVTGGNVSFYNESSGRPIHPTPIVGVLGLLEDATTAVPTGFGRPGLTIWLLGETRVELGGSVWQRLTTGRLEGPPPALDLAAEAGLHRLLPDLAARRLLAGAHDLSDGGLAVALVEATLAAGVGATVDLPPVLAAAGDGAAGTPAALPPEHAPLAALTSESASRVLVAAPPEAADELDALAAEAGVPATRLGTTGGDRLIVPGLLSLSLSRLRDAYEGALPHALGEPA
jgi:phosphoribosylformylglycinamidine synthase